MVNTYYQKFKSVFDAEFLFIHFKWPSMDWSHYNVQLTSLWQCTRVNTFNLSCGYCKDVSTQVLSLKSLGLLLCVQLRMCCLFPRPGPKMTPLIHSHRSQGYDSSAAPTQEPSHVRSSRLCPSIALIWKVHATARNWEGTQAVMTAVCWLAFLCALLI